jgi:hypothetical protein
MAEQHNSSLHSTGLSMHWPLLHVALMSGDRKLVDVG